MTDPLFTLPGWTRAHLLEQYGSLGAIRLWQTGCGKPYDLPDPEYDDEPIEAPSGLPTCAHCARILAALALSPPSSSVDEGNPDR